VNKIISLLSTGLDSPVAAYLMIKKNFYPVFLTFLTFKNQNLVMKENVVEIVKILAAYTKRKFKIYFIQHDLNLNLLKQLCERKLTCILCKRLMIRIAIQIAEMENTNIIVTGDILGEQASQTLDNIYAYNNLIEDYVIIRPLIGWNKLEVINLNKKLGLYENTSKVSISCLYNPQFPETHAKLHEILNNESKIKIHDIVKKAINSAELLEFHI
jgi:thiamine biosynthesis protein ThiI